MENQDVMEIQGIIENQGGMENQSMSRKEKRKAVKKQKRKQQRTVAALRRREEEEALLNDPEEQERLRLMEEEEAERNEREIRMWEERDRVWLEEAAERKRREEAEEDERRKILEELKKKEVDKENELNDDDDDDWEYEEGPAEIIWQGNEIIVKKKRVRISKKDADQHSTQEDADRPTSNPLPPQSEAFSDRNASVISSQRALAEVSEQTPNFGTEQDKTHCPFYFKTGVCRYGQECKRLHYLPDKSHTLLMKNMYSGPGLAWEQDEGLEYTDNEVDRCYEEFYEDVHSEFQKYGEIVNFKVCRNSSKHLRGNVYVHYKSLDSAVLAYHSIHGRYFAGKQVTIEFVRVDKWRAAICGEFMKSGLKTCSRGMACNFIHCFRNPGGDYGWADWDKPPPRYWVKMMVTLFGPKDESGYDEEVKQESLGQRSTSNSVTVDSDRYRSTRRSRSRENSYSHSEASRRQYHGNYGHKNTYLQRDTSDGRKRIKMHKEERYEEETRFDGDRRSRSRSRIQDDTDSGGDLSVSDRNRDRDRERCNDHRRKSSRRHEKALESPDIHGGRKKKTRDSWGDRYDTEGDEARKHGYRRKSSKHYKEALSGDSKYSTTHEHDSDGGWSKNEIKASEFPDHHGNGRYRTNAIDSDCDSSHRNRYHDHRQKRKSSKHPDDDTDPTGDYSDGIGERRRHSKRRNRSRHRSDAETEENVEDEFQSHEFDTGKPDGERVGKHSQSSRKDEMIIVVSSADFLSEDQKSNRNHEEASSSGEHVRRGKSYELDSRYNSDGNSSDKQGKREPEKGRRKSRREKSDSRDTDSGCYSGNAIDKGHCLESVKDRPDKRHHKYNKSRSSRSNDR